MSLRTMLLEGADIHSIAKHLDGLEHDERVTQTRALTRAEHITLYDRAAPAERLSLSYFVPDHVEPLHEVAHVGINNLPAFRRFEKRFCRPGDKSDRLFGFNEESIRSVIGPGYFVAVETEEGNDRGGVVVDYYRVPDATVPPKWPAIKKNEEGLQQFIFQKTRDYMRRVSSHVTVGKAFRYDKKPIGYFILCRSI
jgi:hypothetical protein